MLQMIFNDDISDYVSQIYIIDDIQDQDNDGHSNNGENDSNDYNNDMMANDNDNNDKYGNYYDSNDNG